MFTDEGDTEEPERNDGEQVNFAIGFARQRSQRRYHHTVKILNYSQLTTPPKTLTTWLLLRNANLANLSAENCGVHVDLVMENFCSNHH